MAFQIVNWSSLSVKATRLYPSSDARSEDPALQLPHRSLGLVLRTGGRVQDRLVLNCPTPEVGLIRKRGKTQPQGSVWGQGGARRTITSNRLP